jgi:hypothetical protein
MGPAIDISQYRSPQNSEKYSDFLLINAQSLQCDEFSFATKVHHKAVSAVGQATGHINIDRHNAIAAAHH